MIPKKIHYCWLSGEVLPSLQQKCIDSWKEIMPEYELICWDTNKFDITSNIFVNEAYNEKKWAFATDYIRLYALFTEGGIYMDLDVIVKKKFDDFLKYDFFSSIEYHPEIYINNKTSNLLNKDGTSKEKNTPKPGIGIQAAIMGGIKGHPFLKDCLDFYNERHFIIDKNGEYFNKIIAPDIYAMQAEKYGLKYIDEFQTFNNMAIFPSEIFAGSVKQMTKKSYAIHYCTGSWRNGFNRKIIHWLYKYLKIKL